MTTQALNHKVAHQLDWNITSKTLFVNEIHVLPIIRKSKWPSCFFLYQHEFQMEGELKTEPISNILTKHNKKITYHFERFVDDPVKLAHRHTPKPEVSAHTERGT